MSGNDKLTAEDVRHIRNAAAELDRMNRKFYGDRSKPEDTRRGIAVIHERADSIRVVADKVETRLTA